MLDISMPRGDLKPIVFTVEENSESPQVEISEIFFTVKRSFDHNDYLFQKRLTSGDIELIEDKNYTFLIKPEDTDSLKFGDYVFDIELVGPDLKQTVVGKLHLTEEATHARNEGN